MTRRVGRRSKPQQRRRRAKARFVLPKKAWTPFEEVTRIFNHQFQQWSDIDPERDGRCFANSRYLVWVKARPVEREGWPASVLELSIKARQRGPVDDWRDKQRIKNELVGPGCEAVELFPAEDRLVDSADQAWLFVFPPGERLPFGFTKRFVCDGRPPGGSQRPFEKGARPADCHDAESVDALWEQALSNAATASEKEE